MKDNFEEELYSHPDKLLHNHLANVMNIGLGKMDKVKLNFTNNAEVKRLAKICLLTHDFGKANDYFQQKLRYKSQPAEKQKEAKYNSNKSSHSLLSAFLGYWIAEQVLEEDLYSLLALIIISRHHGNLKNFNDMLRFGDRRWEIIEDQFSATDFNYLQKVIDSTELEINIDGITFEEIKEEIDSYKFRKRLRALELDEIENYLICNYVFSLLVTSDKADAIFHSLDFAFGNLTEVLLGKRQINSNVVDEYKKIKGWNNPQDEINNKRNQIYDQVNDKVIELGINDENKILSLNVPTGTGKTLAALNASLKLRNELEGDRQIIYALPFTSIIDQNFDVYKEVLNETGNIVDSSLLIKHHHLVPKEYFKAEEEDYDYNLARHLIESWESEIIVTTFVQLLHSIMSNQNRRLKKFHNFANSIILLDEVQNIPHKYWELIRNVFAEMAEKLDCYFIFMTATMPLIFRESEGEIQELVTEKEKHFKYFERINLKLEKLEKEMTISGFNKFLENELVQNPEDDVLVVLNTIKSSIKVYDYLKDTAAIEGEIIYLSTNIIPAERKRRIERIKKNNKRQIVISTQLVEAGVDIDLDRVYRDIAPLDSINQVCGRCNRNFRNIKKGTVQLVKLINEEHNDRSYASYIYDSVLMHKTEKILSDLPKTVKEASFLDVNQRYFKALNQAKSSDASNNLLDNMKNLNYGKAFRAKGDNEIFELISRDYEVVNLFIEMDDNARTIWNEYVEIRDIEVSSPEDYRKKQAEFEEIKGDFMDYVITIPKHVAIKQLETEELAKTFNRIDSMQVASVYRESTGFIRKDEVDTFF